MDAMMSYPDGAVTFTRQRRFNPDPLPKRKPPTEAQRWATNSIAVHGIEATLQAVPLGLSTLANSEKTPRARRGQHGITSHGKRVVRFGAGWLEQTYGKERLSFITTTLPPELTLYRNHITSEQWSKISEKFVKRIKYALHKVGLPTHIIGVTEVQEKRMEKHGGVPLHLHWIVVGRHRKGAWALTCKWMREQWKDVIANELGNIEGIDFGMSTRIERVRKSASGYIGKYMSKGCAVTNKVIEMGMQELLPHAWFVCTRELLSLYKHAIIKRSGADVEKLFDRMLTEYLCLFAWWKWVEVPGRDGRPMKVAWTGRLRPGLKGADLLSLGVDTGSPLETAPSTIKLTH